MLPLGLLAGLGSQRGWTPPHSTKAWRTNHSFGSMVKAKYFATEQHYRLHRPIEDIGDQESVPPDLSPKFAYSLS